MEKELRDIVSNNNVALAAYYVVSNGGDITEFYKEQLKLIEDDTYSDMACKKGCFQCCYRKVKVMDSEKSNVLKAFNRLPSVDDVRKRALIRVELNSNYLPCPLLNLKNGSCLIYEDRPLSCRTMTSYSLKSCIKFLPNYAKVPSNHDLNFLRKDIHAGCTLFEVEKGKRISKVDSTIDEVILDDKVQE